MLALFSTAYLLCCMSFLFTTAASLLLGTKIQCDHEVEAERVGGPFPGCQHWLKTGRNTGEPWPPPTVAWLDIEAWGDAFVLKA